MAVLAEGLESDLEDIKRRMEEGTRAMGSSLENALHQAEVLKTYVQETVDVISGEVNARPTFLVLIQPLIKK